MVELIANDFDSDVLLESVRRILDSNELCSIASVTATGQPYINTAFFSYTENLVFYFLSDPATRHGENIARFGEAAMTIFNSGQDWGSDLSGLQVFGACTLAERQIDAQESYASRFTNYRAYWDQLSAVERADSAGRFFAVSAATVKLFDEATFGEDTFVLASINRE